MRGSSDVSPNSSALIALKPRQLLLLEQQQRSRAASTPMAKNQPEKAAQLKPEEESILSFSVALWLENKGFSKVLKRFLSAAQIQDDSWKAKALNLNEIFSKYQEICSSAHEDLKSQKKQDEHVGRTDKIVDANGTKPEEIHKKKKKSKGNIVVKDADRTVEDVVMSEKMNNSYVNGNEDQNQKTSSLGQKNQNTKVSKESNGDEVPELSEDLSTKKQKEKKRKKSKMADADEKKMDVMPQVTELNDKGSLSKSSAESLEKEHVVDKKSKKRSSEDAEDGVNDSKKASKKRKRIDSDENENQSGQEAAVEETKSKKSKGLEANGHAGEDKAETFGAGGAGLENAKQSDESNKSALNNGMDKSSQQKSSNRQPQSSEPKPVKAFQRVKVDEVEFVDERLQDNSYWAKDGADSGYGAKAQEVLGQVKGRDFRHEKTKKKRGSYRGGYIDQQCHSVKFNYSDEE